MNFEQMKLLPEEEQKKLFKNIDAKRKNSKVANFSCQYGVGATTLSQNCSITRSVATDLIDGYKALNWSIYKVADNCKTKEIDGLKWLYNPVSGFWMQLRSDKDRFSALCQSTGAFVFDTFLGYCRSLGLKINMQMHDELMTYSFSDPAGIEKTKELLTKAKNLMNKRLNLNVEIDIDIKYGDNYAETH